MDQLDKKLYTDLNNEIDIPDELDTIIKNGLKGKKKNSSLMKKVASFFVITFISSSIVLATTSIVHEKKSVWEEPERVVAGSIKNNGNQNINQQNIMSEDEAREKANEILERFGYKDENIKEIELQNHIDDYDSDWHITTEQNTNIFIDASGDGSFIISTGNIYKDIEHYRTTKEEAVNTAREIAQKYGYDINDYGYVRVKSNLNSDKESYMYNVTFCKEYDGIRNPYESIIISFIPQINVVKSFMFSNKKFENNPVEITKEKAEEIALNEDNKLRTQYEMYKIDKVETNLRIVSMNGGAYLRSNDYEQLHEQTSLDYPYEKSVFYRTESRIRKAWVVSITYDTNNVDKFNGKYNPNDERFSYFIDATTGEVIGGGSILLSE
ncbi:MAG: hypothetical protein J6J36_03670 [Clostridia bacterium]|nr:hypothetical protein [Clostridia bacterium]